MLVTHANIQNDCLQRYHIELLLNLFIWRQQTLPSYKNGKQNKRAKRPWVGQDTGHFQEPGSF